jgi:hypothetical protein
MLRHLIAALFISHASLGLAVAAPDHSLRSAQTNAEVFAAHTDDLYTLAVRAYVWGYPLVRAAQVRLKTTNPDNPHAVRPPTVPGAPINSIGHQRALSSPETRLGVAPNNDTLYSLAWLDLSDDAFVLEAPNFGERYYTFQMGQADTSTVQSLGQSTHGAQLPPMFIFGPGYKGPIPAGMEGVRAHYRYLMIAGRILVNGATDLGTVHVLQDKIRLRPYRAFQQDLPVQDRIVAQRPLAAQQDAGDKALGFLHMLGAVLSDLRPQQQDLAMLASLQALGMSPDRGFKPGNWTPEQTAAIAKGLDDGEAIVRAKTFNLGRKIQGWSINYAGPHFNDDYLLRAAVTMDQVYVLEPKEALYPSARSDSNGQELDGKNSYRIKFRKEDLPPVNSFWSITLYYAKGFMVPNAIDRWAIGDRTPGLQYGADGSLELLIQHERPAAGKAANWLPAPKEPFMLLMRLYRPKQQILDGTWTPPAVDMVRAAHNQ